MLSQPVKTEYHPKYHWLSQYSFHIFVNPCIPDSYFMANKFGIRTDVAKVVFTLVEDSCLIPTLLESGRTIKVIQLQCWICNGLIGSTAKGRLSTYQPQYQHNLLQIKQDKCFIMIYFMSLIVRFQSHIWFWIKLHSMKKIKLYNMIQVETFYDQESTSWWLISYVFEKENLKNSISMLNLNKINESNDDFTKSRFLRLWKWVKKLFWLISWRLEIIKISRWNPKLIFLRSLILISVLYDEISKEW